MYVCFSHMACQEVCRSPGSAENFSPLPGRFVAYVLTGLLDLSLDFHLMKTILDNREPNKPVYHCTIAPCCFILEKLWKSIEAYICNATWK